MIEDLPVVPFEYFLFYLIPSGPVLRPVVPRFPHPPVVQRERFANTRNPVRNICTFSGGN